MPLKNVISTPKIRTFINKGEAIIIGVKKDENSKLYKRVICLNTGNDIIIKEAGYISRRAYFFLELRTLIAIIAIALITSGTLQSIY